MKGRYVKLSDISNVSTYFPIIFTCAQATSKFATRLVHDTLKDEYLFILSVPLFKEFRTDEKYIRAIAQSYIYMHNRIRYEFDELYFDMSKAVTEVKFMLCTSRMTAFKILKACIHNEMLYSLK